MHLLLDLMDERPFNDMKFRKWGKSIGYKGLKGGWMTVLGEKGREVDC